MEQLPAATAMGPVALSVADLERSLDVLPPFDRARGSRARAATRRLSGPAPPSCSSWSSCPARRRPTGTAACFISRYSCRSAPISARWLTHAGRDRVQLTGASDHFVSEALYLRDPDHHGIEIYADRPRELWEGQRRSDGLRLPLDLDDLLRAAPDQNGDSFAGLPAGTTMGHVHLRVSDVDETVRFYRDLLGFDLMAQLGPQAAFLSAGGYHHHLGGEHVGEPWCGPAPEGTARLQRFTIVLPDEASRDAAAARVGGAEAEDPSGNRFSLVTA